jgi:hypothetical protein
MDDDEWTEERVDRVLSELLNIGWVKIEYRAGDPFPRYRITHAGEAHIERVLAAKK